MARAVRFAGRTLPDVLGLDLAGLCDLAATWPRDAVTGPLADALQRACTVLCDLGLGGITAARDATTLSASEWQRVRLAAVLSAELSGVLWILDEPTAGLDSAHTATAIDGLRALRDRGNGLLVVTHDPDVVRAADRVIEFGPGPGVDGGRVVFDGTPAALARADTATARALAGVEPLARTRVHGAPMTLRVREHPVLAAADIPLRRGALNAVTGPAGAGRTLVLGLVERADLDGGDGLARVVAADGAAARASWRSMPATYIGLWDTLRDLLAATTEAAVRGLDARAFSLAVPGGRCEACEGRGSRRVELGVLPPVDVPCAVCEGRRFAGDVLAVTWKGLDAAGLLGLTVDAARPLLSGHPRLDDGLRALADVGLGHITLGQAVPTLSGGEARRLRLARELVRAGRRGGADTLVVLDDPTVGLHPADVPVLARTLDRLVQEGATVVIATRDPALLAIADHIVTLAAVGRVAEVSAPAG